MIRTVIALLALLVAAPAGAQGVVHIPTVVFGTANQVLVNSSATAACAGKCTFTLDPTIAAWGTFNTNGILTQTAADTFTARTLTGTTNQITVTNGDGVSGNPTFSTPQDIHTGASPSFVTGTFSANLSAAGWLRVGSNTTPANTTAGDLTAVRLSLGGNSALSSVNGALAEMTGTLTDTASGAKLLTNITATLDPAGASASQFRTLNMSATVPAGNSQNCTDADAATGIWTEFRHNGSGTVTNAAGIRARGMLAGGGADAGSTITTAIGLDAQSMTSFSHVSGLTVDNAIGVQVRNATKIAADTLTRQAGIVVQSLTVGTNASGIVLGQSTIPTGSFGLYNAVAQPNYFAGNMGIGTATPPTGGGASLALAQGTQPTGIASNTAGIWVQDVTGVAELMGFDENGNDVQLTPHDFRAFTPDPSDPFPWTYAASNRYLGIKRTADMSGVVRAVERLTGQTFIYDTPLPASERLDWRAEQDRRYAQMAAELATWEQQQADYQQQLAQWQIDYAAWEQRADSTEAPPVQPSFDSQRPPDPVRKDPPYWLAQRLAARGLWMGALPDPATQPPVAALTVTPNVGPDVLRRLAVLEQALAAANQRIADLEAVR